MLSVALPNGDLVEYLVDGMGRRVRRKKNGVLLKQWVYRDALKPVAELDGAGNLVAQYAYGSKSNVPDYVRRGGATYRVVGDHLGSPRYVVNVADSADVPFRADYSSFGEVTGTGLDWMPFGFAGGAYDSETQVVRFGTRDYDPSVGRWTAKDRQRFLDATGLYEYSRNDPLTLLDPAGFGPAWNFVRSCWKKSTPIRLVNNHVEYFQWNQERDEECELQCAAAGIDSIDCRCDDDQIPIPPLPPGGSCGGAPEPAPMCGGGSAPAPAANSCEPNACE